MVSARELNVKDARRRGNATRGVRNVVRLEAFLVSSVNFLAENGVFFIRRLIDIYGVDLRLPRVWKLFFVPVYARFCFLFNSRVPASFLDARVARMGQWKATKNSAEIRAKRRRPWRSI